MRISSPETFEPNRKSVNLCLIAITVGTFFLLLLLEKKETPGAFYGNTTEFLLRHGALYGPAVRENREWYRLVTYLFLHSGMEHLAYNMLILYFIGNLTEKTMGRIRYAVLYFCSGILAGVGSIVYNGYRSERLAGAMPVCVGASGAIFGVSGAVLYLVLVHRGEVPGVSRRQIVLYLILSLCGGLWNREVDNVAHLAGLVAGFVLAAILYRRPKER